jgi:hypothetical protein
MCKTTIFNTSRVIPEGENNLGRGFLFFFSIKKSNQLKIRAVKRVKPTDGAAVAINQ